MRTDNENNKKETKTEKLEKEVKRLTQLNDFLNSIIENLPHMIFLKDAEHLRFVRVNKAGEQLIGFSQSELLGKNDYDFFPKNEADFFTQKDRQVLHEGKIMNITEEPIQTRYKGLRHLHTKKVALYDHSGKPAYLLGISEDITEQLESREKIKKGERELDLILGASGIGRWFWNFENDKVTWDKNMYTLFGISEKEFNNDYASFEKCLNPEDVERVKNAVNEAVEMGLDFDTQFRIISKPGKQRTIAARGLIHRDLSGKATHMMGINWDITGQQEKQALEIKSELISIVSHELRTPIHTIKEGINVVLEGLVGEVSEEQEDVLSTTKQCIDRLTRLINNVLDFQKIEAGMTPVEFEEEDLNQIIKDLVEIERPNFENKNLILELELDEDLPKVELDSDKIIQVFTNLIHNAIKFTEKGAILITSKLHKNDVVVSIKDSGVGFNDQELSKIFTVFGQTESGKRISPHGTGLGLAISKKIIEQHDGKIWAKSFAPMGSVFTFQIPIKQSKINHES